MDHDPTKVAATMVAVRGREAAYERCNRYIAGTLKSENSPGFWQAVKAAILEGAQ